MNNKTINIGLFGFGCVGYGLYQVLEKTPTLNANIVKICIKNKNKERQIAPENFTFDQYEILNNDSIDTIVELIDDSEAAFEIVKLAMQKGKAVVTANKKMIAEHFTELIKLQKTYNTPLLYEAAACASIPIIRNLEEYYDNDLLESLAGIVNGSTNYILTKTVQDNITYLDALKDAQIKGYAESNPTLDTGGFDAKYKLTILLAHAFGLVVKPEEIINIGIDKINDLAFKYAKEKGFKIKLIAQAFKNQNGQISALVAPQIIASTEKLFLVDDVYNGVLLQTAFAENQFFVGKGAGAYPTASAVLSDISALSYQYKYEYKKIKNNPEVQLSNQFELEILTCFNFNDLESIQSYFTTINEYYQKEQEAYIIGTINFKDLEKIKELDNVCVIVKTINSKTNFKTEKYTNAASA